MSGELPAGWEKALPVNVSFMLTFILRLIFKMEVALYRHLSLAIFTHIFADIHA